MLVNDEPTSPRRTPGAGRLIALAILVLVVGLAAWRGWAWWQARGEGKRDEQAMTVQRLEALEARAEALRRDQRAQAQRLLDAAATNRVLRDEVLGLGQRGALLEESVAKLTDPDRHGAQALRLDEVELLLSLAAQRLEIAHDPAGARRAYALAAGVLDGLDDHRLLNLKQALAQERVAVDALGAGARADAFARLDSLADAITDLPRQAPTAAPGQVRPAWQRWLDLWSTCGLRATPRWWRPTSGPRRTWRCRSRSAWRGPPSSAATTLRTAPRWPVWTHGCHGCGRTRRPDVRFTHGCAHCSRRKRPRARPKWAARCSSCARCAAPACGCARPGRRRR